MTLAWRCAACWQAAALRLSIDGHWLQAAAARVGEGLLHELLAQPEDPAAPLAALPRIEHLDHSWRRLGLAVLLASLSSAAQRKAVAAVWQQRGVVTTSSGPGTTSGRPGSDALEAERARDAVSRALRDAVGSALRAGAPGARS